ncbi:maleylpyruvate isomerase N-terminal domain-containing protein [Longispora albida]|uniref:maleylpyruvate isomerase N-terminal domain-containing protein n=1 Tax=Longispora albida TaxID=203523 RepID=UPI0003656F9E|nr:maleylpyruvate isomerase N-terminal domain-containing protein [Longispora albida]
MRDQVTTADLRAAVAGVAELLGTAIGEDWTAKAGTTDWTCAATVRHLGEVGVHYAAQLAVRAGTGHVRVMSGPHPEGTNSRLAQHMESGGALLAAVVESAPPDARAFHAYGIADPEGWAAMGCAEFLLHGGDLAAGLGVPYEPDGELCGRVLARLAPQHTAHGLDGWLGLRYASGRAAVPGLPSVGTWRWQAAPA